MLICNMYMIYCGIYVDFKELAPSHWGLQRWKTVGNAAQWSRAHRWWLGRFCDTYITCMCTYLQNICIYIYVYTNIHVYVYIYIYRYMYIYISYVSYLYMMIYMYMCNHVYVHIYIYTVYRSNIWCIYIYIEKSTMLMFDAYHDW